MLLSKDIENVPVLKCFAETRFEGMAISVQRLLKELSLATWTVAKMEEIIRT